jgi:tetratricopeptide (TPR) repeat protein
VAKSFEHLSDAQLEHYGTKSFTVTPEEEQKIEAHLEDCANCRSRVLENQRVRFGLLASSSIKAGARVAPGSVHPGAVEPGSVQGLSSDGVTPGQPVPADWDPYKPASTACIVPDGPSEDDLRNLAAGIIVQEQAMAITQHAVECPHCASILRLFVEDFSDDLTAHDLAEELADDLTPKTISDALTPEEPADEQAFLAQLKSSTPKWQQEIAAQAMKANRGVNPSPTSVANPSPTSGTSASPTSVANPSPTSGASASSTFGVNPSSTSGANASSISGANSPSTSGAKIFGWPMRRVLAPAAIAASALLAFGLWFTQRDTPEKVERLLAQAYTEQRTMEYRWPGAEWGPVRVTRGAGQSHLSRPSSQLEAEKILAEHQGSNSSDPKWLTAKAEAEMLDNEPQLAIADLTQALATNPGSSNIELMLAIAYAQQGDKLNDNASWEKALEFLDKILRRKTIADPAAMFDRALLHQRLNIPEKAAADWDELLKWEHQPSWKPEDEKRGSGSK